MNTPISTRKTLLALLGAICLLPISASAIDYSTWGDLDPGPHAVGFRVEHRYDGTWQAKASYDHEGKPNDNLNRHFQVAVWYPAEASDDAPRMLYEDYIYLVPQRASLAGDGMIYMGNQEVDDGPIDEERKANGRAGLKRLMEVIDREVAEGGLEKILKTPTAAVRDAPAKDGPFPAVLYRLGGTSSNSVMCEYLASHGYIVVSFPDYSKISWVSSAAGHGIALQRQVADIEYVIGQMRNLENVDPLQIGILSYDFPSVSHLIYQFRHLGAKALASLEGGEIYASGIGGIEVSPFFEASRIRVPMMYFSMAETKYRDFSFLDSLKYSDRYVVTFDDRRRDDFLAHFMVSGTATGEQQRAYELTSLYVRKFFDAFLREDPAAVEFLADDPVGHGAPAGFLTVERRVPRPVPPSKEEFWNILVGEDGVRRAEKIFRGLESEERATLFGEDAINLAGYRFLRVGKTDEAVRVMKMMTDVYPDSWNAHDSLGEAYLANGDKALALTSYRRSLELEPGNDHAKAILKEHGGGAN